MLKLRKKNAKLCSRSSSSIYSGEICGEMTLQNASPLQKQRHDRKRQITRHCRYHLAFRNSLIVALTSNFTLQLYHKFLVSSTFDIKID